MNPNHLIVVAKMRGRNLMATRLFRQCSFLSVRSESNHIDRSLASRVFPLDKWQQDCSCSLWLWSSSRSSSLLLPGLEKLPTLGGDRIWNLRAWKLQMGCWERREERGNCPFVNYHPNWKDRLSTLCYQWFTRLGILAHFIFTPHVHKKQL